MVFQDGVEWPRFEDGQPVKIGDEFLNNKGNTATVTRIALSEKHFTINKGQGRICKTYGNRIKRPEPEVLDADGVPIKVGDTVYYPLVSGSYVSGEVEKIESTMHGSILVHYGQGFSDYADRLTHRKPDTQEAIDADAGKEPCAYFNGTFLDKCSACKLHDGENDIDVLYDECRNAQVLDLLQRQRKLLGGK